MTSEVDRDIFVNFALELLPPRVQESLFDNDEFVKQWKLETVSVARLGKDGPNFRRDQLYNGIREAISALGKEITIKDDKSVAWQALVLEGDEGLSFSLKNDEQAFSIPDHSGLAEDHFTRVKWFERVAREVNLEAPKLHEWRTKIDGHPLSDDEFMELKGELELTPSGNYQKMTSRLMLGSIDIRTLIPRERRFYDRLVGSADTAVDTTSYFNSEAAQLIDGLQKWDRKHGFLKSLLICSRGDVSERIFIDDFGEEELLGIYEWIANQGDPVSQIAAVEVALRNIECNRKLEPFVEQIVEGFISDDPGDDGGCFSLLSSMIVLVASELSRIGVMKETNPFYRRQAAIAQASLIIRAVKDAGTDSESIIKWANTIGVGHIFFLQGLVDLRLEPRWLPDFVSPEQLRAEFIGRVSNAVAHCTVGIQSESLCSLIVGQDSRLATAAEWPMPVLPGPLEGELTSDQPNIPEEVLIEMAAPLEADVLGPNSFAGIVNMALLYNLPASQAGLAATALRRVRYSIEQVEDEDNIFGLILSLATLAAVTRASDLAETLRVLTRVMRRRKLINPSLENEFRIAMMAAASHEELEGWARFVGDWITELAFEALERNSAQSFLQKLRRVVQIEPALARHCAMADAAIASVAR